MQRATCVSIIAAALAVFASSVESGEIARFESREISLAYEKSYYDDAKLITLSKALGPASPHGMTGPKRSVIELKHQSRADSPRRGGYYHPASSAIYVTPLFDRQARDFAAAYPSLHENALALRKILLLDRQQFYAATARGWLSPATMQLPDEPFSNAAACLLAHYKRLSQPRATGCRMLTYYRNGLAGYGATNTELHYQYQGLTADERFFITARLAVRNDRLPDSIDDPRAKSDETEAEQQAERKLINGWEEETFYPPLSVLDEMIASIQIKR